MTKIKGNVCFFHRQTDDKWIWFIADEYGRQILTNVEPFNDYEKAVMDYNIQAPEFYNRLVFKDNGKTTVFDEFFQPVGQQG